MDIVDAIATAAVLITAIICATIVILKWMQS
jgi:hypothetical protein